MTASNKSQTFHEKLLTNEKKDVFFIEAENAIKNFMNGYENNKLPTFNHNQVCHIRYTLLAIGNVRLARRSQDIMKFSIAS